jgi:uncharacterized protein YndB with AHSA1/START domain
MWARSMLGFGDGALSGNSRCQTRQKPAKMPVSEGFSAIAEDTGDNPPPLIERRFVMRWLKVVLGVIVVFALGIVIVGFTLPSQYRVERSVVINAPPARIYPLMASPRHWQVWTIWTHRDPKMNITYFGPNEGTGAGWRWDSKTEGRGEMTFENADPDHGLTYKLDFPDYNSTSTGEIVLVPEGAGTRVTWTNHGDVGHNPLMHYMAAGMDRLVGPDFEAGLQNLKVLAEKPA